MQPFSLENRCVTSQKPWPHIIEKQTQDSCYNKSRWLMEGSESIKYEVVETSSLKTAVS